MGDPIIETPNLDALASEGVVFPYGYATASTCRPSLRSLLTGLHPVQWNARRRALRAEDRAGSKFDPIRDFATLPRLLGTRGYQSFQTGKYWETTFEGAGFTHGMKRPEETARPGEPGWIQVRAGGSGLAIGRSTMQPLWDFLEQAGDERFFVWFAPSLPHTPHDPPREFLDRYADADLSGAARAYYANITRFDAIVGELIERLEAMGLRDDTLLVYLSDNGWDQAPRALNPVPELGGVRGKSSMYELGFRTPIVFQWPGRIPGGRTRNDLVSEVDLFTTLLDFAGLEAPPDRTGINLRPALLRDEPPQRTTLIGSMGSLRPPPATEAAQEYPAQELVRFERAYFFRNESWRYIWYAQRDRFEDRPAEQLYRIDRDPHEEHDVVSEHPDLAKQFRAEIERWLEETRARTKAAI
jgi:arylsulfatase A-like enzyme